MGILNEKRCNRNIMLHLYVQYKIDLIYYFIYKMKCYTIVRNSNPCPQIENFVKYTLT